MDIVERIAHRLVVLRNGSLIFDGSVASLREQVAAVWAELDVSLDPNHGADDLCFGRCPSVVESDGLKLRLSADTIGFGELELAGLRPHEVRGKSYRPVSLRQSIDALLQNEGV